MTKLLTNVARRLRRLLRSNTESPGEPENAVWCAVANVSKQIPAATSETRRGTKHFRPGALVYCPTVLWGDGYENIKVVARHRGSHRYVTMVMRSACLTNWRVKLVYSPHVIREFQRMGTTWDGSRKSKKLAEKLVAWMTKGGPS